MNNETLQAIFPEIQKIYPNAYYNSSSHSIRIGQYILTIEEDQIIVINIIDRPPDKLTTNAFGFSKYYFDLNDPKLFDKLKETLPTLPEYTPPTIEQIQEREATYRPKRLK